MSHQKWAVLGAAAGLCVLIFVWRSVRETQVVDPREVRLRDLELRLAKLEKEFWVFDHAWTNTIAEVVSNGFTVPLFEKASEIAILAQGDLAGRVSTLESVVTTQIEDRTKEIRRQTALIPPVVSSRPATPLQTRQGPPSRPPQKAAAPPGVPQKIYDQIAAEAAARWKSDYHMQEVEIRDQIKAYRALHP